MENVLKTKHPLFKTKLNQKDYLFCILFSGIVSVFWEVYATAVSCNLRVLLGNPDLKDVILQFLNFMYIKRLLVVFIVVFIVTILLKFQKLPPAEFLYKHRFILMGIVLSLLVIFELSGSSIGMWKYYITYGVEGDNNALWGVARPIRGDEWALNTPMAISQAYNGYSYFTNIIRGCTTDTFIVYGQPVFDIAEIFRPFHWGYLILGSAKGLSFFWYGRLIALFLVTLELMMLITNNNKRLSFIGSLMVTLAPIVQWWFAINGLVEMLVFGQLAVLMLYHYMKTNHYLKRCLYLLVIIICAGGYVLTFYPSWMVPLAYVFLALAVWVFITNFKSFEFSFKNIFPIIGALVLLCSLMYYIFTKSGDTVNTVLHTVYPGSRFELGGDVGSRYFLYPFDMLFAVFPDDMPGNVCEHSVFFDLFPLPILLSVWILIKNKKKDILTIILLVVSVILGIWCIWGFPAIIAKLSLLSFSQSGRSFLAVGLVNIFLLIRALSLIQKPFSRVWAMVISIPTAVIITLLCSKFTPNYVPKIFILGVLLLVAFCFYFALRYKAKYCKNIFTVLMVAIMILCGGLVNPVQNGLKVFDNAPVLDSIEQINNEKNGLWMVEGNPFYPFINLPLLRGIPTINSTNVYPNLERWELIDPEGKYTEIYNRYAHIWTTVGNESEKKFELIGPDTMKVNTTAQDLQTLGVNYILSMDELEQYSTDTILIKKIFTSKEVVANFKVYEVQAVN